MVIDATLNTVFVKTDTTTEDGLSSLVPEDNVPDVSSCDKDSYWKIVLFRRAMFTVITRCCQYPLLPNTSYNLLLQHSRSAAKGFSPGPEPTTMSNKSYSVKAVSLVTLDPFSGLTSDFKDWYDSVANAYGICGHQQFLDEKLSIISYSN